VPSRPDFEYGLADAALPGVPRDARRAASGRVARQGGLGAYLAQVRAERAAVLLLHSDAPVTSIGRAVGWPDQNYFARRFKARYGLSAATYRKRFAAWAAAHQPGAL
jgi:AraC-like DNA-binding protein